MATEYFNDAWRIPNNKNQSLVSNYSMEFDGSGNDSITIPSYTIPENSTVSFWVKSSLTNPQDIIISGVAGHYYPYFLLSGGNIRLIIKAGSISNEIISDVAWVADTWFHIAITGENGQGAGSTATYYINGVSKGTSLHRAPTLTVIGDYTAASLAWNGQIDQVCFFDYALPATGTNSIATLYGGGTAVTNPMSLNPKPVAYYQLGDQSVDNGANYLVPNNSLQDYVFSFDGTNDVLSLSEIDSTGTKTYSCWINPTVSGNNGGFLTLANIDTDFVSIALWESEIHVMVAKSTAANNRKNTVQTISTNQWYHIVVVKSTGSVDNIYINGVNQTLITNGGWNAGNIPAQYKIGSASFPTTPFTFSGSISNVATWNAALNSTEVTEIYNQGSPLNLNTFSGNAPTAWWKLNAQDTFDGTSWTIKDYAGSNDGTSVNMTSANLVQSNLQHTSGFSPYALSLDGISNFFTLDNSSNPQINPTLLGGTTSFTVSAWIKPSANNYNSILGNYGGGSTSRSFWFFIYNISNARRLFFRLRDTNANQVQASTSNDVIIFDSWQHLSVTYDESNLKIFINGVEKANTPSSAITINTSIYADTIGSDDQNGGNFFNGEISNVAVWRNSVINPVTLYNNGVPANLNNLSTKPSYWFQLGSNSSFNSNTNKWTCLNEGTTRTSALPLNATTSSNTAMTNDDITNGVGYSANGLGTSSIEIVGDAPYSTANGISENMDVLDRTTDVPPTV